MRIRKYDHDYSRRVFLQKVATGASAGVLAPLWPTIANSADDITKAYPDELLSISVLTKGKIKPGDVVTANNVEVVKDLLDPVTYQQVATQGRRLMITESTRDVTRLFNSTFLEKTLQNQGKAKFGDDGNVYVEGDKSKPWIGGLPFPEVKTGLDAIANITLSWGRHDYSQYAIGSWSMNPSGEMAYRHEFIWSELNTTNRLDGTVFQNMSDKLRLQTVFFTGPNDVKGSSFLSVWYYDQRKFPDLHGYFPAFKRVRQFPTNQRFEPVVPGMTFFLSDAWAAGDPMLTWGDYKIVSRGPMLAAVGGQNWRGGYHENWEAETHGGPAGQTFWDTYYELVPEMIVFDAVPTGYPRAPVGRKRVWMDARNMTAPTHVTYDRRGALWKGYELGNGATKNDKTAFTDDKGRSDWSWLFVHSHDIQSNRMTRFRLTRGVGLGYKTLFAADNNEMYNQFLTTSALGRLGK